jgi:penicillin-binding protein 1A
VDFMKAAHEGYPVTDFARPSSIVVAHIDAKSGLLAPDGYEGARDEEFLEGTEPEKMVAPDAGAETFPLDPAPSPPVDGVPEDVPPLLDDEPPF